MNDASLLASLGSSFNVRRYGAIGDGTADDTAAFQAAITAALWVQAGAGGGTVFVPAGVYRITQQLNLYEGIQGRACNMVGEGIGSWVVFAPTIPGNAGGFWSGAVLVGTPFNSLWSPGCRIAHLGINQTGGQANWHGVYVFGGKHHLIEDVMVQGFALDGIHAECGAANQWIERLRIDNVQSWGNGRDNYNFTLGNYNETFITETLVIGCTSRQPGRNAMRLVQNNQWGGNFKISNFFVRNCELDARGGSDPNVVTIEQGSSVGGNIIENVMFDQCTIEDTGATHSGYSVGFTGSGTQPIQLKVENSIYYGCAGGVPTGANKPVNVSYGTAQTWY
jgi:hypothetical protein